MKLWNIKKYVFGTLRGRLILGVAMVHAVMMTLFIIDLTARQRAMLLDRQIEEATALAQSLSTSAAIWIATNDISGLQEIVDIQLRYPELVFAILTDEQGLILAHTDQSKHGLYLLDLPSQTDKPVVISSKEMIQVLAPAKLNNRQIGWAHVGLGRLSSGKKLAEITFGGILYALAAIVIGSFIAWWMGIWFTRRLYAVQNTIRDVRKGNPQARSKIEGTDEAASIASEFNVLLDTLDTQQSTQKQYETQILKLNRIYSVISNINQAIVRIHEPLEMMKEACRIAFEYGKFKLAWIGIANPETNKVDVTASFGETGDYLNKLNIDLSDPERNSRPTGTALITGVHKISNNILLDKSMAPWRDNAVNYGYKSSASFPLIINEKVIGTFNLYSDEIGFFQEDDIKLLDEMAIDISFALEFIEAENKRKMAEVQRIESEARYQKAEAIGHVGNWEYNLQTTQFWGSDEAKRIYGFDQDSNDFSTSEVESCIPERERVHQALIDLIEADKPYNLEFEIHPKNSLKPKIISSIAELKRDKHGNPMLVTGVIQDITERKQAEQDFVLMNFALNNVSEAAFLVDENACFHFVNDESCRVLRYSRAELFCLTVPDIDPDFSMERWHAHWNEIKRQHSLLFEGRHKAKDGTIFPVEINANYFEYGGQGYNLALVRDITERKLVEKERQDNLHYFESIDRINRAMQRAENLEQMMSDILDTMLSIFGCDRAFLAVPCDPTMPEFKISMERTTPFYPGAFARGVSVPMSPAVQNLFHELLSNPAPNEIFIGKGLDPNDVVWKTYEIKSQLAIALHPKLGKPWECGLHQCSYNREWTPQEKQLFLEISRRLGDGLTSLLAYRHLQESEQRFRMVFEHSPVSIWEEDFSEVRNLFDDLKKQGITNIETYFGQHPEVILQCAGLIKIVDVNQSALLLQKAATKQELITNLANVFTTESFDTLQQELICLWNSETEMVNDSVVRTLDGNLRNVTVYVSVCPGYEESLSKIFVSLVDITDRKQAENMLIKSEKSLNEAQRIAHVGSWELDIVNNNLIWSDEIYQIFEIDPQKFGASYEAFLEAIHPDDQDSVNWAYTNSLNTKTPYVIDHRLLFSDGRIKWVHEQCESFYDPVGKPVRSIGIVQDITERKKAEEEIQKLNMGLEQRVILRTAQLEAANKELEAFSYSVSHDLRAPLRSIDGFSQILLEEYQYKVDAQGKNYLQRIRVAAQRMAQLIDDMLNLSRVSRGEMNIQQVNLSEIAKDVADNIFGNQPERKVEFIIQEGITVWGDGRLLRIILENLIGNAWKFTSKHPTARIEFGVQQQKGIPVYFVRDDGAGFEMNYAQKLFGAFQRLHSTIEFSGTGIGLATVQRVVHRHGGKVWAEGEVEKGATFYFTIA